MCLIFFSSHQAKSCFLFGTISPRRSPERTTEKEECAATTLQHRQPIKRVWEERPTGPQRLVTLILRDGNGADAEAEESPRYDGRCRHHTAAGLPLLYQDVFALWKTNGCEQKESNFYLLKAMGRQEDGAESLKVPERNNTIPISFWRRKTGNTLIVFCRHEDVKAKESTCSVGQNPGKSTASHKGNTAPHRGCAAAFNRRIPCLGVVAPRNCTPPSCHWPPFHLRPQERHS